MMAVSCLLRAFAGMMHTSWLGVEGLGSFRMVVYASGLAKQLRKRLRTVAKSGYRRRYVRLLKFDAVVSSARPVVKSSTVGCVAWRPFHAALASCRSYYSPCDLPSSCCRALNTRRLRSTLQSQDCGGALSSIRSIYNRNPQSSGSM